MTDMSATASDATGHQQHANELHAHAALRLRDDDQRYTSGRRALVELLADADRPLTVSEVLDRADGLAQSSAYRNLALLERAGVVHRIVTDDEFGRFELAEDLTGHHHHHLICTRCGQVEDFTIPADLEHRLDTALHQVATATGFTTDHHRLDLVGTCAHCQG
jgi:Fur family transcriptional regulator, ferric uptake regulator